MEKQTLGSIVGGLVGGALATLVMKQGMKLAARMPEGMRPPEMRQDPGEYVVGRIESRSDRQLSEGAHRRAAKGLSWVYGIGWASALALFAPRLRMSRLGRAVGFGAALGATVWAVGYLGWLPRTRLVPPVREQGASHHASAIASHLTYGIVAALPIYGANRLLERC